MTGNKCAVFTCKNNTLNRNNTETYVSFHAFPKPKDPTSKRIRCEWIKRCGQPFQFDPSNKRKICSIHFKEDDYERDLRSELLGLPAKKKLKKTAIPSLILNKTDEPSNNCALAEKVIKIEETTDELMNNTSEQRTLPFTQVFIKIDEPIIPKVKLNNTSDFVSKKQYERLLEKYKSLRIRYKKVSNQLYYYHKKYNGNRRKELQINMNSSDVQGPSETCWLIKL